MANGRRQAADDGDPPSIPRRCLVQRSFFFFIRDVAAMAQPEDGA